MKKWKKAVNEQEDTKLALDELTDRISPSWILEWRELETRAMTKRGEALKIYDIMGQNSFPSTFTYSILSYDQSSQL